MNIEKYGVACALIHYTKQGIYLSERLGSYETGKFACPGGMVDDTDASHEDAILRELREETGLDIDIKRLVKAPFVSEHIGGKSDFTVWYFVFLTDDEVPMNMEEKKHGDWKLHSFQDIEEMPLMVSTTDVIAYLKKSIVPRVELKFMVVPEQLRDMAYVPHAVKVKIIDPEAIFLLGILGESGRKLVEAGIEFYFAGDLAKKLIEKKIAIEV